MEIRGRGLRNRVNDVFRRVALTDIEFDAGARRAHHLADRITNPPKAGSSFGRTGVVPFYVPRTKAARGV